MVTIVFFSNTKIVTLGKNPAGFIPLFLTLVFFVYRTTITCNIAHDPQSAKGLRTLKLTKIAFSLLSS